MDRGGITITFDDIGVKAIFDRLLELENVGSLKVLAKVLRKSSKRTTLLAIQYAPLGLTGELKESIRTAVRKPKSGNIVVETGTVVRKSKIADELDLLDENDQVVGTVGVKRVVDASWRWHWVEFGSIHNIAYGYLRKAWDETSKNYVNEIKAELEKEVKKALAKSGVTP